LIKSLENLENSGISFYQICKHPAKLENLSSCVNLQTHIGSIWYNPVTVTLWLQGGSLHVEYLPYLPSSLLIAQAVFLFESGPTQKQTHSQTQLTTVPTCQLQPMWVRTKRLNSEWIRRTVVDGQAARRRVVHAVWDTGQQTVADQSLSPSSCSCSCWQVDSHSHCYTSPPRRYDCQQNAAGNVSDQILFLGYRLLQCPKCSLPITSQNFKNSASAGMDNCVA